MADYALDTDLIARMVMKLVPFEGSYQLSMDRTEWDFGTFRINILALGIVHKGCAFPVLFTMLPKKGNSSTAERVALIERSIRLFGREALGPLLADREFVGHKWAKYLMDNEIKYFIRVKENFMAHFPKTENKKGKKKRESLFARAGGVFGSGFLGMEYDRALGVVEILCQNPQGPDLDTNGTGISWQAQNRPAYLGCPLFIGTCGLGAWAKGKGGRNGALPARGKGRECRPLLPARGRSGCA